MAVVDVGIVLVADALETREIQVLSAQVQVLRKLAPDLPSTSADADQIEQVLANLIANAIQALDNHLGKRVIEVTTEKRDDKIRIVVADSGPGIPLQILDRIFDPFFTTKGPGKAGRAWACRSAIASWKSTKARFGSRARLAKARDSLLNCPW